MTDQKNNWYEVNHRHLIISSTTSAVLTLVNLYYLLKFVKLQQKTFHLVMFLVLQTCYVSIVISYIYA